MTTHGMHIGTTCVDEHEIFGAASVLTPGEMEVNAYRPSQDPRRASSRIRDTAEGVLVALRRSSLNQAFIDVVHTAKSHNTSPLSLADAPVGIAQGQPSFESDDTGFTTTREALGHRLILTGNRPAEGPGHNDQAQCLVETSDIAIANAFMDMSR